MRQRTIKTAVTLEGIGLQTGKPARVTLKGSPANSGINFIRVDLPNKPLISLEPKNVSGVDLGSERRTVVSSGPAEVHTTEHLMAALWGSAIDNVVIEIDAPEVPGMDGSALEFLKAIKKAGIVEQDAPRRTLSLKGPVWVEGEDGILAAFPAENFRVSYTMSYKAPALGTHFLDMVIDERSFASEIAPARTFCLKNEALILLACGLGRGANTDNTLVMATSGPVKNRLRFPDEPVRHKVLDLIGDLYLTGMALNARIVAVKSGHRLNLELVKKIRAGN